MSLRIPTISLTPSEKDETVSTLISAFHNLLNGKKSDSISLNVCDLIFQIVRLNSAKELFDKMVHELYIHCSKISTSLSSEDDISSIVAFVTVWDEYYSSVKRINQYMGIVNQSVSLTTNMDFIPLDTLACSLYYEIVYISKESLIQKYIKTFVEIDDCFYEEFDASQYNDIDAKHILTSLNNMYSFFDSYIPSKNCYENIFIHEIKSIKNTIYNRKYNEMKKNKSTLEFYSNVSSYITSQIQSLSMYISNEKYLKSMIINMYNELIYNRGNETLEYNDGFTTVMNNKNYEFLHLLYSLYNYTSTGFLIFRNIFKLYIYIQLQTILDSSSLSSCFDDYFLYINRIRSVINTHLCSSEFLLMDIYESETLLFNRNNKYINVLMNYISLCIETNNKNSIILLNKEMKDIYPNILNKEYFEYLYRMKLLYRYIYTSFNIQYEIQLFDIYNSYIPFSQMSNIRYLLKDIANSKITAKSIQKTANKKKENLELPLNVSPISKTLFTSLIEDNHGNPTYLYAPSLSLYNSIYSLYSESLNHYISLYNSTYSTRKIDIIPEYTQLTVQFSLPSSSSSSSSILLHISLFQYTILQLLLDYAHICFQSQANSQVITLLSFYNYIKKEKNINIPKEVLMKTIELFYTPYSILLVDEPINNQSKISFNKQFSNKNTELYIPPLFYNPLENRGDSQDNDIDIKGNHENDEAIKMNIYNIIDAMIVHLLKKNQVYTFKQLLHDVEEKINSIYFGESLDIPLLLKRELEVMEEREFIMRDEDDMDTFTYLE
ncbi:hypothetical protein WA158_006685 [Blastocystis sp. Blastoise]